MVEPRLRALVGYFLGPLLRLLGSEQTPRRFPVIGPAFGQLLHGLFALCLVVAMGVAGYVVIADLSAFDALYQTVITITTIGFEEVEPLGDGARAFTIALAVVGVTAGLYILTAVGRLVVEGELVMDLGAWHMTNSINVLREHFIVCGSGRVGQEVAAELEKRGVPFVLIDFDPETVGRVKITDWLVVEGDASDNDVLQRAGIDRARALLAVTASDAQNTFITLTARGMRPDLFIVARANEEESGPKQLQAGADRVVSPMQIAARRLAFAALNPAVGEPAEPPFGPAEQRGDAGRGRRPRPLPLDGAAIGAAVAAGRSVTVLGLHRAGGELLVGPSADTVLAAGDTLIVMGDADAINALPAESGSG